MSTITVDAPADVARRWEALPQEERGWDELVRLATRQAEAERFLEKVRDLQARYTKEELLQRLDESTARLQAEIERSGLTDEEILGLLDLR